MSLTLLFALACSGDATDTSAPAEDTAQDDEVVEDTDAPAEDTGSEDTGYEGPCSSVVFEGTQIIVPEQSDAEAFAVGTHGPAITLEGWFKPEAVGENGMLFYKGSESGVASSASADYLIAVTPDDELLFTSGPGDIATECDYLRVGGELELGTWQHLAFGLDPSSGTKTVHVDGEEVARCTIEHKTDPSDGPVTIGGHTYLQVDDLAFDHHFQGRVDQVRVSRSLRYSGDFTPELRLEADGDTQLLLNLDEGEGLDGADGSGFGYDAWFWTDAWAEDCAAQPS